MQGKFEASLVCMSLAGMLAGCGGNEPVERPQKDVIASRSISFSGFAASSQDVAEGTLVTFTGDALVDGIEDSNIEKVEMFYGEIDPETGLEFREVLCDDADAANPCGVLAEKCDGSHVYRDSPDGNGLANGDHTATCEVTGDTTSNSASLGITVNEVATTVDANAAEPDPNLYTVTEETAFTTTATFSDPSMDASSSPPVLYESYTCTWNWGDGTPENIISGCTPATVNTNHVYTTPGDYVATLSVENLDGDGDPALNPVANNADVKVLDREPAISPIVAVPDPSNEGESTVFSADITADPGEPILSCSWNWGDGSPSETDPACPGDGVDVTASLPHTYAEGPNSYTVTLTVEDADSTTTRTKLHEVRNLPPVVDAGGPYVATEGSALSLTLSFTDPGVNDTHVCRVIWGDGAPDSVIDPCLSGDTAGHVYTEDTTAPSGPDHTLTVEVTDDDGDMGSDGTTVTVDDVDPVIGNLTNDGPKNEAETVSFSADVFTGALDGTSDPITACYWDPGDGTGELGPFNPGDPECGGAGSPNSAFSHLYAQSGNFGATLRVVDEDSESIKLTQVTVENLPPDVVIDPAPAAADEGDPIVFTGSFSDAAGAADGAFTCEFDFGDGTVAAAASGCAIGSTVKSPPHAYADDSEDACGAATCTVTLTVTDKDGGAGSDSYGLTVNNASPTIDGVSLVSPVAEGSAASASVEASDPGADDVLTYSFDWNDDGCSEIQGDVCDGELAGASHFYPDEGTYTLRITVKDDDGGSATTTRSVTVTDTQPEIVSFYSTAPKGEGQSVTAVVEMNLAQGDDYTFTYDFGDGFVTGACGRTCSHTYGDDGSYTISVTVVDDEANQDQSSTPADIYNIAPTPEVASGCGSAADAAGGSYACDLDATDPAGPNDTITFTLAVGPDGMGVDGSTGLVSWTPTADQTRSSHSYQVEVADEDGGSSLFSQTVSSYLDTDGDGLPDIWEDANGTDKNVDDAGADPDGDGKTNLEEFQDGTNPQVFNGPDRPAPISPIGSEEVSSLRPTLRTQNAADPDGDPLTYTFEVFMDAGLTSMVASTSGVAAGTTQVSPGVYVTDWTVDADLTDDHEHWWRVRATDGNAEGANSSVVSFFVNTANDAPTAPALSAPAAGSEVPTVYPTLQVGNATDVDRDTLTYTFEIATASDFSAIVTSASGVAEGANITAWTSDIALADDSLYFWRARAVDGEGLAGTDSATGSFFVNTTNNPPSAIGIVSPADGEEVATDSPALTVTNATDSDGDTLTYEFQVDVSSAFNAPVGSQDVAEGAGETAHTFTGLAENTVHYWRARAFDGISAGDWVTGSFFVNSANDAPGTPSAQNPSNGSILDRDSVTLTVRNTTDPDRDALTYSFTIYKDEALTQVHEAISGVAAGANGETSFTPTVRLGAGKAYFWSAEATDDEGLAGDPLPTQTFKTIGGGGGGCSTAESGRSASGTWLVFLGLAGAVTIRKRQCQ